MAWIPLREMDNTIGDCSFILKDDCKTVGYRIRMIFCCHFFTVEARNSVFVKE